MLEREKNSKLFITQLHKILCKDMQNTKICGTICNA